LLDHCDLMPRAKQWVLIATSILAAAIVVFGAAWYQPIRHVIYNDMAAELFLMEEHSSVRISPKHEEDVGVPRGLTFLIGTEPMIGRIRFEKDGTIKYRAPTLSLETTVRAPESWAHDRYFWREFHYRYDVSGELSVIPPSQAGVANQAQAQPAGFPICLARVDSSRPNSGLTTRCSRPPSAAADRTRYAAQNRGGVESDR
jgi:hypothetical protein